MIHRRFYNVGWARRVTGGLNSLAAAAAKSSHLEVTLKLKVELVVSFNKLIG